MKLSLKTLSAALLGVSLVAAAASPDAVVEHEEGAVPTSLQILIDYTIDEYPDVTNSDVAEISNGEEISIRYEITNNEDQDVSVVGVSGAFRDPVTNEVRTNLTSSPIGPIAVAAGETQHFIQKLNVDLIADSYLLSPALFLTYDNDIKVVFPRGQLFTVSDIPISIFNPQLLLLEAILVASIAGFAYIGYSIWGKALFDTKVSKKKPLPPQGHSTGADSWLPEGHVAKKKSKLTQRTFEPTKKR